MSYCLNPACQKPDQNLHNSNFCQSCGKQILLQERYRAVKIIGQGGFGKTFLAVDIALATHPYCVIKQFFLQGQPPKITQKAVSLFQQEAKRLESLGRHSQVPKLYTYLEQNSQIYIVQEFIEGETLAKELEKEGIFTEEKIRNLLSDLLSVLKFVHQGQVIHRDIKPDNIIRRKSDHKLVLVDFGAAKEVTQTALMRTGTIIGSIGYTAPEQAHGKAVFASDIFSLGVTCINLLTKVEPYNFYDPIENKFVWRHKVSNLVSRELIIILEKMTQPLVKQRYQSASEILQILARQKTNSSSILPTIVVNKSSKITILQKHLHISKLTKIITACAVVSSVFWGWQTFYSHQINKSALPILKLTETIKSSPKSSISPSENLKPTPFKFKQVNSRSETVKMRKAISTSSNKQLSSSQGKIPKIDKTGETFPSRPISSPSSQTNIARLNRDINYDDRRKTFSSANRPKRKTMISLKQNLSNQKTSISMPQKTIVTQDSERSNIPSSSSLQPWEIKNDSNPTSEIENTIRSNQP